MTVLTTILRAKWGVNTQKGVRPEKVLESVKWFLWGSYKEKKFGKKILKMETF